MNDKKSESNDKTIDPPNIPDNPIISIIDGVNGPIIPTQSIYIEEIINSW